MVEFTPEILAQAQAMGFTEEEAREKWADIDAQYNQGGPAAVIKDMEEMLVETEEEVLALASDARAYFHKNRLAESAQKWLDNWSPSDFRVLAWSQYLADIRESVDKALAEGRVDNDQLIHWLITATWMIAEQQDQLAAVKDGNRRMGESG